MRAYITAAFRTAVVPRGGAFAPLDLHALAAPLVAPCLAAGGLEAARCRRSSSPTHSAPGQSCPPHGARGGACPSRSRGLTIDRQCAGGLDAIRLAAALVGAGAAEAVLAGGVESFRAAPCDFAPIRRGGHPCPMTAPPSPHGPTAIPRWHRRQRLWPAGWASAGRSRMTGPSPATPAPAPPDPASRPRSCRWQARQPTPLRAISPRASPPRAPVVAGSVTAANTAVEADAAALCLVVSERLAAARRTRFGWPPQPPLAPPDEPGLAPLAAIRATLGQAGIAPRDLATAEIMEAYAVQAIACVEGGGLDPAIVNPGGGALARGHPIGASGAILAVRLFHERATGHGLAAIAAAGGIGTALLLST